MNKVGGAKRQAECDKKSYPLSILQKDFIWYKIRLVLPPGEKNSE